jgi:hypothetical protein
MQIHHGTHGAGVGNVEILGIRLGSADGKGKGLKKK